MFTARKTFTALTLATSILSASAFANDSQNNIMSHTDFMVESAMMDVKQSLELGVTFDVLTASHTFEPEVEELIRWLPRLLLRQLSLSAQTITTHKENANVNRRYTIYGSTRPRYCVFSECTGFFNSTLIPSKRSLKTQQKQIGT